MSINKHRYDNCFTFPLAFVYFWIEVQRILKELTMEHHGGKRETSNKGPGHVYTTASAPQIILSCAIYILKHTC